MLDACLVTVSAGCERARDGRQCMVTVSDSACGEACAQQWTNETTHQRDDADGRAPLSVRADGPRVGPFGQTGAGD